MPRPSETAKLGSTQTADNRSPAPFRCTWSPEAIRNLIEALECKYGVADPHPRYEPVDELVSCILTQHTTDATAFPAFDRLKAKYPSWDQVVAAGEAEIAATIRAVGLANQKSRSILSCLREICARNDGYHLDNLRDMPTLEARSWLMELPGVGPKTASIVLSFSLGKDVIPVDTHVYRVSWRLGLIPEGCGESKAHDLLLALVPRDLSFRYHVALIRHGRQTCKAPLPSCGTCEVRESCAWMKDGGPDKKLSEMRSKRKTARQ